jgi:hypothetical protein
MEGVVLLSEGHPAMGVRRRRGPGALLQQARDWHGLIGPADRSIQRQLCALPVDRAFAEGIALLHERARQRGQVLVLREWSHLDFHAAPYRLEPTYQLSSAAALAVLGPVRTALTVRHPLDQWQSLRVRRGLKRALSLEAFCYGTWRFAEIAAQRGFLRYEALIRSPEPWLRALCQRLALPYDSRWRQRWRTNRKVTGDIDEWSRGGGAGDLIALPRRPVEPALARALAANSHYQAACQVLGYDPDPSGSDHAIGCDGAERSIQEPPDAGVHFG